MTILEHGCTSRDMSPEEIGQAKALLGEAVEALRGMNRDLGRTMELFQVGRGIEADLEAADSLPDPKGWLEILSDERRGSHRNFLHIAAKCLTRLARSRRGRLAEYAEIGRVALYALVWQRNDGEGWTELDYLRHVMRMESDLRRKIGPHRLDLDRCIRIYAWIDAVRAYAPGAQGLGYAQVVSRFLPLLEWNPVGLEGEIRSGWNEFMCDSIARQVSGDPLADDELEEAIAEYGATLAAPRRDVMRPIDRPSRGHRYASPELARPRA